MTIFQHIPVLPNEICQALLVPLQQSPLPTYFDGTFGRGGHFQLLLENIKNLQSAIADKDLEALDHAKNKYKGLIDNQRLKIFHGSFFQALQGNQETYDAILIDLGVSSPQIDNPERGFSFMNDGPMDMRMDQSHGFTASDICQQYDEKDLIRVFQDYGEIRSPFRVVRAIVHDRKTKPFTSTKEFADMIARIDGWRKKGFHPATLYFQALRIEVNQELAGLSDSLSLAIDRLKPMGRLAVLTFHSLEDRIVKNTFKQKLEIGSLLNKKVITASDEEEKQNPRSRSAKLRVFVKNG